MPPTAPPEFLRYSPSDIVQMGRERGTPPEQIAQAVTKHRDNLTAYGMQTHGQRFNEALPRLQQETNTALEELKPGFGVGDALSGIGSMLGGLTTTVPAAYYGVTEGFTRPDQYSPEARAAFDANAAYQQRMQQESQQRLERGEATSTGDAFRSAGPSLGGTVGSMAAAIPAGMATGALVGTAIEPGGGTVGGGLIGAAASGIGAAVGAGTVAYRMAGQQFLNDAFNALREQRGGQMSEAEMQQAYNELLPLAENSALWEAGPEAIGNAVTLGTAKVVFGLGKPLLTNLAKTALGKAGVKVGAIAGNQAVELGTETATALGQDPMQAQADAYARGDANWQQARGQYDRPGGTLQALKDITPATLALGATTLGAGGVVKLATLPFQKPNDNVSPNQTPAPTGTPQAPGTTPATAAMAGAPGAVPSTLSRIAQESLVADLPDDTGALTAEEVVDLERVGQPVSEPNPLQAAGAASPMPGSFRVTGEGSIPLSALSSTASVTKDSGETADQTAQNTPGAGLSPATGASLPPGGQRSGVAEVGTAGAVPSERSPEAQAYAEAVAQAAETARQSQIAKLRQREAQTGRGPVIPDSPLGVYDILDFVNENKIRVPRADGADRKAGEYDWTETYSVPQYYRKFLGSSERGGSIDQVAQQAFENGFIREPTADALMGAIQQGIDTRKQYKVQFAKRAKEQAVAEKQTLDFEKTQQTLRRKDKDQVRFEDIAPGDEMTIDGEQAVVKNIEYTEDGYLTNVVIEDGKRFGLMNFDAQTRSGLFVDEFTPKKRTASEGVPEEPLFSRAAPRMDFSGLMQGAQAVASGAQAPNFPAALAGMIAAPTPGARPVAPTPGNGGARGVNRFFQSSPTINSTPTDSNLTASRRLADAYRAAVRGSSTQMAPLSSVYAQARLLQPGLTPDAFLAQVQEGYNNGTLYLEGAGSQQEAAQAGLALPGTNVGTAVRMMPAPPAAQSLQSSTQAFQGQLDIQPDAPQGLFTYDARADASLTPAERDALRVLRSEYPGQRLAAVKINGLQYSPDAPRAAEQRVQTLADWTGAFSALFGKRVLFFDGPGDLNGAVAQGQRNVILVNANGPDPLLYILGHELTHSLRAQRPELYKALEKELLASGRNLDRYREKLRGLGYKDSQMNEEMTADFVGSQFLEPDFLNRLAADKPTLFARFSRAVISFINGLLGKAGKLTRDIRPHFKDNLEDLRDQLAAALKEYSQKGQFPDNPMGDTEGASLSAAAPNETQSRFASPNAADRVINGPRTDELVAAEANAWLESLDQQEAIEAFARQQVPLPLDAAERAAAVLISRLSDQAATGKTEVLRMWAHVQSQRMARIWTKEFLSADPARALRQRGVVNNTILAPIAPVMAAQELLTDRATKVIDARFNGGAEGAVEKVKEVVKKADDQASTEVAQAVQDTVELAPPVDPAAAKAAVQAVTKAASSYFGGTLPARVKIVHQELAEWDARMNGNVLELNAAALETAQVPGKIEHEIGHLLFQDPAMRQQFDTLWNSLDVNERAQIENITAALYDAANRNEEASVRALDAVRQMLEAKNPSLWQRFVAWIRQAWERFTGKLPRDPQRLAAVMIETGVARLKGVEGNQTGVRESRRSDLLKVNSPQLARLLNSLRLKVAPGMKWADIFMEMPSAQKERQREIYKRLMQHRSLVKLSPNERLQLTNELDKAWLRARKKVFDKELEKMGVLGEEDATDRKKVKAAAPRLLRLMNLGMLDSAMFREAMAKEYGLKMIDAKAAAELRALGERIQTAPEGLPRRKLEIQLMDRLQTLAGTTFWQVMDSWWTASVLSGWRTQVDIGLSIANGIEDVGLGSLVTAMRTGNKDVAIRGLGNLFGRIPFAFLEAVDHVRTGNKALMRNFELEAKQALEGGNRMASDVGAQMWRDGGWRKVPGGFMIFYGRLMTALDHVNSASTREGAKAMALARHPELYQKALRISDADRQAARQQARLELTGGAAPATPSERLEETARVREILDREIPAEVIAEATEVGRAAAMQGEPTGLGGALLDAVLGAVGIVNRKAQELAARENPDRLSKQTARVTAAMVPIARAITGTKFARTVAHSLNRTASYVPVIGAYAVGQQGRTGAFGDILAAKQVIGTLVGIALYLAFDDDDDEKGIEDSWKDKTPQQKAQLYAQGKQPFTIWERDSQGRVRSWNYQQWGVAGIVNTVAAMLKQKGSEQGTLNVLMSSLVQGGMSFTDKAQLQGLQTVFGENYRSTDPAGGIAASLNKWAAQTAGGIVPRLIKDIDMVSSPELRSSSEWWQKWAKEVPMVRQLSSGKRVDILGADILLDRTPLSRVTQVGTADPVYRMLGRLNEKDVWLPDPSQGVRIVKLSDGTRRKMTEAEKDRYQRLTGAAYRDYLNEQGERLLKLPPQDAQEEVNRVTTHMRTRAAYSATH